MRRRRIFLEGPQGRLSARMGAIEISGDTQTPRSEGSHSDFASETVGSSSLAKTKLDWRHKSSDCAPADVGRSEAPSMPCGQGKSGEERLVGPGHRGS